PAVASADGPGQGRGRSKSQPRPRRPRRSTVSASSKILSVVWFAMDPGSGFGPRDEFTGVVGPESPRRMPTPREPGVPEPLGQGGSGGDFDGEPTRGEDGKCAGVAPLGRLHVEPVALQASVDLVHALLVLLDEADVE